MGTPRYMSPEQVAGEPIDLRSDLFAAGAILFEMLAGRPAFAGRSIVEVLHATRYEQPPALTGSPAVAAVDRVIRRALAKRPADRPVSADAMADELRAIRGIESGSSPAMAQALTRLVVLPFRVLRPDAETDFLAFSLPDAIATSLSGNAGLIVRSSAVAARFATGTPDLKALAAEADVDRVVMGTLLRAGDQLRATAQLVDAPGGTLLTSHTVQASLGDLFGLQDDIARRVADALSLPLAGTPAQSPDRPARSAAPTSCTCAPTSWRGPTTASPRRAISTSSASSSIRASRRRGPGSDAAIASSASTSIPIRAATRGPRTRCAGPWPSTRACRWRTSSTPTSKPTSARRRRRCAACSAKRTGTATIPSCSPGSSTRAATAACSSSRSPRTPRPAASIPTSRPASSRR